MRYIPLLILVVLAVGLFLYTSRSRQKAAVEDARMRRDVRVGTQVMTTSGLYGTVTAIHDDDTVTLSIAPGVEVKWAFAALRDAAALPPRYRTPSRPATPPGDGSTGQP